MTCLQEGQHSLLWVVDFPMFEWNEEEGRLEALHHPFTAPNPEDLEASGGEGCGILPAVCIWCCQVASGPHTSSSAHLLSKQKGDLRHARALAYDMVYNGVEVGGGSLRIYRCAFTRCNKAYSWKISRVPVLVSAHRLRWRMRGRSRVPPRLPACQRTPFHPLPPSPIMQARHPAAGVCHHWTDRRGGAQQVWIPHGRF